MQQSGCPSYNPLERVAGLVTCNVNCTALLGRITGHFKTKAPTSNKCMHEEPVTKVNSGIAIVVPSDNILELLMRDDVREDRQKRCGGE